MNLEPIGIMSAMPQEIDAINARIAEAKEIVIGKATFTIGTIDDIKVVTAVLNFGWGKVDASTNATILATTFGVKSIIFSGVAGAFDPKLNIGDIVICDSAIQHDFDASPIFPRGIIPSTQKMNTMTHVLLRECAERSAETFIKTFDSMIEEKYIKQFNLSPKWITGKIATGDQFLSRPDQIDAVRALADSIQAVDMESAAVLHVAERFSIPAIVMRVMSDNANHTAHVDFISFIEHAARMYSAELVTNLVKELKINSFLCQA
jgi:adenosylhomocysteine nucleosidase